MKRKFSFEKKKFLSLSEQSQHKKCLEFLRAIFDEYSEKHLEEYNKLALLMNLSELIYKGQKDILDRYHFHREKAKIFIREDNLLYIKSEDNLEGASFLPISIYLDKIRSQHNFGSIIRTCEAFRLGNIYVGSEEDLPNNAMIKKVSMGTERSVSIEAKPLNTLPRPVIALETISNATPYYNFSFPDTFTLVLGNEERGCSEDTLSSSDSYISIPLFGKKNSINVACAFAIIASEISRQKRRH